MTDSEAETPILWLPDVKNWLFGKDPDAEKDWREEKGMTEGETLDGITDSMDMSLSNSGSWWWTGRPGVLQFMGSQRVGHDWVTELNCSLLTPWSCFQIFPFPVMKASGCSESENAYDNWKNTYNEILSLEIYTLHTYIWKTWGENTPKLLILIAAISG